MSRILEKTDDIEPSLKFKFLGKLGELKIWDSQGLGSRIQILGTIAELCEVSLQTDQLII